MPALTYERLQQDTESHARLGRVTTLHGAFETPAFMPVGTQGTVKGLTPDQVRATGAQIILGNTYHLLLRPGSELVAQMGGLQDWTRWGGPMLTDSGGFQVFSLAGINDITEDGVRFKSHLDGTMIDLTPERSMQVQHELGADIMMAFDDCPPAQHPPAHRFLPKSDRERQDGIPPALDDRAYAARIKLANERTLRWLDRCVAYHKQSGRDAFQSLFPIVQGGTDLDQRDWCVERIAQHDAPGYAIGGVAVGEGPGEIRRVVEHTAPKLPGDRPRYLMGVGYERDIVAAVRAGVDMFDCVLPTRNGRRGVAFTPTGPLRLKNASFREDPRPIQEGCDCVCCRGQGAEGPWGQVGGSHLAPGPLDPSAPSHFSRSYLRHLFHAGEQLGPALVSLHNLRHFQRLLLDIRRAIRDNAWSFLARDWPVAFDAIP
ncbi:tRNA guanosine(34) transglycosylase Tgt [Phycisphaeraceae bacterium D3-23]